MAIPVTTAGGTVPVLILKEGAKETRGREAQRNNITAAKLVAEIVKTSLGPRGMDKMLVDTLGDVTITNDGATILKEMDVQHPAAKMMVEISKATDNEVGDGTTSVVVLAGALLERAEELINKDVHPTIIVDGYKKAADKAIAILREVATKVEPNDKEALKKVAITTLSSKIAASAMNKLADLVIDAVLTVAEKKDSKYRVDIDNIKVEKKAGESLHDTQLIRGIVLD
ncbi:MAG: TCP-1/cpn60 chaperonin family protein, partial [Candidatus Nitrosocaldus sp.]